MPTPIRILHVFGRLDRGGAESRTMDIYRSIDRSKVQFDFIVHTSEKCAFDEEVISLGGNIYKGIPRFKMYNFLSYYKAWNVFFDKHGEYNAVHIHTANSALPILASAKKHGVKVRICHARQADEYSFLRRLFVRCNKSFIRRYATKTLAVSDLSGKFIFGKGCEVINNAIRTKTFIYSETVREEQRKKLGLESAFVIGFIGRMTLQKNHMFFIKSFKGIVEKVPNARLILIGDGELREEIENKIKQLGIEDKVILLGVISDVPSLMQAMDMLVLPSFFEGLPGVAVEAQAAGLKTFLSDKTSIEVNIIKDLVEFLPIDKGTDIWVDKIVQFAESGFKRRDTYEEMVIAGFDVEEVAKWYEEFYLESVK